MSNTKESIKKVLIIGGGFAGTRVAKNLARQFGKNIEITLISKKAYFEYYPALYRVVTGSSPIEVCVPLHHILPKSVKLVIDEVTHVDLKNQKVALATSTEISYDYVVLAVGSETTYFNLPGLDTLSLGFKSVHEALHLKNHIYSLFMNHKHPNENELTSHFHVVIVGGGPSGVEVAGDLTIFMKKLAKTYGVDPSFVTIDIVESNARVCPTLPPETSAKILARLRKLGINIFLNRKLTKQEIESVYLKDMSLQSKTVIWTAGTQLSALVQKIEGLEFSLTHRVSVDDHLRAKGYHNVYVVGDLASTPYAGLAQTAIYDGRYVAKDISTSLRGSTNALYKPKKNAFVIPVGENWAAFVLGQFRLYGRIPYMIRHLIDFFFFATMVPPRKLFSLFFEGWKYRKLNDKELGGTCKI